MEANHIRRVADKLKKTEALLQHPRIARHVPPTRLFTSSNLRTMLQRYGAVVLKPQRGGGGRGVMKVMRSRGGYRCIYYATDRSHKSFAGLLRTVRRLQRGKRYLIQKYVALATIGGRPIDYRVKVVKMNGRWTVRAMVGRVARRGLFVTNLARGGIQLRAAQGIRRSLSSSVAMRKKREMRSLTRTATAVLEQRFPGLGELGFDYGLDRSGRIWIFEVNTRPG